MTRHTFTIVLICLIGITQSGCIKKIALKKIASTLTAEGGTVFTGDDDPQLIADALPFALKTYESLLTSLPNDADLLYATGKAFCMYAYAFVQVPADTISDLRTDVKNEELLRAKRMYLRAKKYLLRALEIRHPGINALINADKSGEALAMTTITDTSLLYWTGAAWMGAFTTDKFDMTLTVTMPVAVAFMNRLLALKEDFGNGSVHDFFISYYGSMPQSMGGSEPKARDHFQKSIALSKGTSAGPYVSLATSVCIARQDVDEFKTLCGKALAIDADAHISNRLANIICQRKARWLLGHIDNYFLIDDNDTSIDDENTPDNPEPDLEENKE